MARNIADPKSRLEAAALVKAMHAGVFAATLQEDVITVPGPSCRKRSIDNGSSMALTPKFGVRDNIFEKSVSSPGAQEVRRGDQHTSGNDLGICDGYEDRNAFIR